MAIDMAATTEVGRPPPLQSTAECCSGTSISPVQSEANIRLPLKTNDEEGGWEAAAGGVAP